MAMPESPETPSWGPPVDSDDPGWMPESPDTPSWGPPVDSDDPGWMPESPETPPWGPPTSGGGSVFPPIIVVPGQPTYPTGGRSNVRFLYAATGQPAVDIRIGNRWVINHLQFGNSTPYYLENSGSRMIQVTDSRTGATLYRGTFTFQGGVAYTVALVNSGSGISLMLLVDMRCNNKNAGCVRAVNLSPNSGPVDVFLSGVNRAFQHVDTFSVTDYRMIRRGVYRAFVSEALPCSNSNAITISEGYVACNNSRLVIMDSASVNVMNGVSYTLYVIGRAYQFPALQLLPLESDLIY